MICIDCYLRKYGNVLRKRTRCLRHWLYRRVDRDGADPRSCLSAITCHHPPTFSAAWTTKIKVISTFPKLSFVVRVNAPVRMNKHISVHQHLMKSILIIHVNSVVGFGMGGCTVVTSFTKGDKYVIEDGISKLV